MDRLWPERQIVVEINHPEISASYPTGHKLVADLSDLVNVKIITNDSGPWGADVWFSFNSTNGRCRFPQGATGEDDAVEFLLKLDGFDESRFIKAMGSTSNEEFICWQK